MERKNEKNPGELFESVAEIAARTRPVQLPLVGVATLLVLLSPIVAFAAQELQK